MSRWFVGLSVDDPIRDPTMFTEDRQFCRKRLGEVLGRLKAVGQPWKLHHRGTALASWVFLLWKLAYNNVVRMQNLSKMAV